MELPKSGIIIPLYSYPTSSGWAILEEYILTYKVPTFIIVNPNSGVGGSIDANYTAGIASLKEAGAFILGYVATNYGVRSPSAVEIEMDTWRNYYSEVDGIFMDEVSWVENEILDTSNFGDLYSGYTAYAKSIGFDYVVGNPGTACTDYMFWKGFADTLIVAEGDYSTINLSQLGGIATGYTHYQNYEKGTRGALFYNADFNSITDANIDSFVFTTGLVYITHDYTPNIWDDLSSGTVRIMQSIQRRLYQIGLFGISFSPATRYKFFGILTNGRESEEFKNISLNYTIETLELHKKYIYNLKIQALSIAEKLTVMNYFKTNSGTKINISKLFFYDYEGGESIGNEVYCDFEYNEVRPKKLQNGLFDIEVILKTREV